jgi:hypothetical protein
MTDMLKWCLQVQMYSIKINKVKEIHNYGKIIFLTLSINK